MESGGIGSTEQLSFDAVTFNQAVNCVMQVLYR